MSRFLIAFVCLIGIALTAIVPVSNHNLGQLCQIHECSDEIWKNPQAKPETVVAVRNDLNNRQLEELLGRYGPILVLVYG